MIKHNGQSCLALPSCTPAKQGRAVTSAALGLLSTGESFAYDANGNTLAPALALVASAGVTSRVENGLTYTQNFDAENRLTSVIPTSGVAASFKYDGDGNLVAKLVGDVTTYYIGGLYEVEVTNTTVTKQTYYYPAGGAIRVIDGGGDNVFYLLKDHLGSASVTLDSSGNAIAEARYYPFGETRVSTGTTPTDKRYQSQRDVGLGLMHFGARFYHSKLGRFISADTIVPNFADPQALNRYAFVLNNPLKYIDPTGHTSACANSRIADPECAGIYVPSPTPSSQSTTITTYNPCLTSPWQCGGAVQPSGGGTSLSGNNGDSGNGVSSRESISPDDLKLITLAVFAEGSNGTHSDESMRMVAWVWFNRASDGRNVFMDIDKRSGAWKGIIDAFPAPTDLESLMQAYECYITPGCSSHASAFANVLGIVSSAYNDYVSGSTDPTNGSTMFSHQNDLARPDGVILEDNNGEDLYAWLSQNYSSMAEQYPEFRYALSQPYFSPNDGTWIVLSTGNFNCAWRGTCGVPGWQP